MLGDSFFGFSPFQQSPNAWYPTQFIEHVPIQSNSFFLRFIHLQRTHDCSVHCRILESNMTLVRKRTLVNHGTFLLSYPPLISIKCISRTRLASSNQTRRNTNCFTEKRRQRRARDQSCCRKV
mmetsp:Transcript_7936/g.29615  ORF Transcript_7936/g.29615 Transcript_7936/m.29615 type:complete len:123 (-) Transcript_7936:760-1128(-)